MKIIKLDAIDSTNSYLKKLLNKESLDDLTVVVSKHQTQGRGRNGNIWSNKPSLNLAFSIYKRFSDFEIDKKFMLNVISSISVYETLKKYNFKVSYFSIIIVVSSTALLSMIIENEFINLIQIFILILLYSLFINFSKSK